MVLSSGAMGAPRPRICAPGWNDAGMQIYLKRERLLAARHCPQAGRDDIYRYSSKFAFCNCP
jgi:hypothetical protein